MIGGVAIMIKSGLSYSITDLSSNIEAIIVNMHVLPTSEFIAENYKDLISKPSSLIVGDLNAYSPLWGENKTDQDLFVSRTRTTMAIGHVWILFRYWPFSLESPSTFSSCFFLIF